MVSDGRQLYTEIAKSQAMTTRLTVCKTESIIVTDSILYA